jgi:hypothetical protein
MSINIPISISIAIIYSNCLGLVIKINGTLAPPLLSAMIDFVYDMNKASVQLIPLFVDESVITTLPEAARKAAIAKICAWRSATLINNTFDIFLTSTNPCNRCKKNYFRKSTNTICSN